MSRKSIKMLVTHQIAGLTFQTESNAWVSRLREEPYDLFCVSNKRNPDVYHRIYKVDSNSLRWPPIAGEERMRLSRCVRSLDRMDSLLLRSPVVLTRLQNCMNRSEQIEVWVDQDQVIIRDFSCNQLDIYYTEKLGGFDVERQAYIPEYYVGANFQQMFSSFLSRFSIALIHSSGVIRGDRAPLFLAPDGGGKTTVLRHSNSNPILSDDHIVLQKKEDVFIAHGTPFGVLTSGPCQARLGALFFLERAPHFELTPLEPPDLVQCLWTEHRNYTFFLPQYLKKRAFQLLSDVCHKVPVYKMRFSKDYVDWDAIDAAMEGRVASKK